MENLETGLEVTSVMLKNELAHLSLLVDFSYEACVILKWNVKSKCGHLDKGFGNIKNL